MGATAGVTRDDVARLIAAVGMVQRLGRPVTGSSVCSVEPSYEPDDVDLLLGQEWFVAAAAEQGVTLSHDRRLTARQLAALSIYFDSSVRVGHARRLQLAGVPSAVWDGWLLNPAFADRLAALSEDRLRAAVPVALQRLAEATDDGVKWAVELTLEMSGRHDRRAGTTDLPTLFRAILNILDEEVSPLDGGEQVVLKIAERLTGVADRAAGRTPAQIGVGP